MREMSVILLEDLKHHGVFGAQVRVAPGFARNYLIPQGKALPATPEYIAQFEAQRETLASAAQQRLADARARAVLLEGLSVRIATRAAEEGRLYGSVHAADVVAAIAAQTEGALEVRRQEVSMPEAAIRMIGIYTVELRLHPQVQVSIEVQVIPA